LLPTGQQAAELSQQTGATRQPAHRPFAGRGGRQLQLGFGIIGGIFPSLRREWLIRDPRSVTAQVFFPAKPFLTILFLSLFVIPSGHDALHLTSVNSNP
jgi:hypothetical protein